MDFIILLNLLFFRAGYEKMGVSTRSAGHAARAVKTKGNNVFFCCRLARSSPKCCWSRMLQTKASGTCSLYRHNTQGLAYSSASKLISTRGVSSVAEKLHRGNLPPLRGLLCERPGRQATRNALASRRSNG